MDEKKEQKSKKPTAKQRLRAAVRAVNENSMLEPLGRLNKDVRAAAANLSDTEARYLVDLFYQIQEFRKASGNQVFSMLGTAEPTAVLGWTFTTMETIEKEVFYWLDKYTEQRHMGRWARAVKGIGPTLAAGLIAHIDIAKAPTAGSIWRFAGLDPTAEWGKGEKRPHNARLKVICWKMGEQFLKVCNKPDAYYGHIYLERKRYEIQMNEAGAYASQAAEILLNKNINKNKAAYPHLIRGRLSPGHIEQRSKRYAVKLFLSHWHEEAYRQHFKKEPPLPYPIAHLGHVHMKRREAS